MGNKPLNATWSCRYVQEVPTDRIIGKLVQNVNWPGPKTSLNGWPWMRWEERSDTYKPKFMSALRESIQREGFRNPILLIALPEGIFTLFGVSRFLVAKELGIPVKALISDHTNEFYRHKLVTMDNYKQFFKDPPIYFEFLDYAAYYHYSMERSRRADSHDPAGVKWCENEEWLIEEFPWIKEKDND